MGLWITVIMIVGMCGYRRATIVIGGKRNLLTASPSRSNAGEEHKEQASGGKQAFHL